MIGPHLFHVYCDESCHLELDGVTFMAWGAIACPEGEAGANPDALTPVDARELEAAE